MKSSGGVATTTEIQERMTDPPELVALSVIVRSCDREVVQRTLAETRSLSVRARSGGLTRKVHTGFDLASIMGTFIDLR